MTRATRDVALIADSALALRAAKLEPGMSCALGEPENDVLVYVAGGTGALSVGGRSAQVRARTAGLVPAGEEGVLRATDRLELVVMSVGPEVDRHAPMGPRALTASLDDDDGRAP